jgi:hypothetical protein
LPFAESAFAQSTTCKALQDELTALNRQNGGRANSFAEAAQRQVDEMQRISAYMRQIGCNGTRFLFFGPSPPAQCGELAARLSRMQANLAGLQGQAEQLGLGPRAAARREQVIAAIRQYCDVERRPLPPPDEAAAEPDMGGTPEPVDAPQPDDQGGELPPGKAVCVRLCDGYFFPLASLGKHGAQEMCQAQCPGSETEAFSMGPEEDIAKAVGQGGKSYMELENALRYQKATVPGCSCRKADQSWGQALKGAEDMLGGSDPQVSPEKAAEMSRTPAVADPKKAAGAGKAPAPPGGPTPAAPPATRPSASLGKGVPPPVAPPSAPQPRAPGAGQGQPAAAAAPQPQPAKPADCAPKPGDPAGSAGQAVGPDCRKVRIIAPGIVSHP